LRHPRPLLLAALAALGVAAAGAPPDSGSAAVASYGKGSAYVVEAGPEFEVVGQNPLDEPVGASAAVAGGTIDIRGQKHLFAIGDAPAS